MVRRDNDAHRSAMERMFDALNIPRASSRENVSDALGDLFNLPSATPEQILSGDLTSNTEDSPEESSGDREALQGESSERHIESSLPVPGDFVELHGGALPIKATASARDQALLANDPQLRRLLANGDMRGVGGKVKRRIAKMGLDNSLIDWDAYHDAHPDRYGTK